MNDLVAFFTKYKLTDFRFPSVDFIDIIDILIVAFFIYNIIIWIKETRAWSLFKGIIVILGFSVLAVLFNLSTILFILKNAISVGIIAIIVVFQPELRKALDEIGRGHFMTSIITADYDDSLLVSDKTINEILKAVQKMSELKTGALIVIEQHVPLGDHERTGIPLDSVVTSQLLINLFEKGTPLHDGAVIIRNNRVSSAACFLPLTDSSDISMELGTRHRAALGVSEVSDAFVIIVSEETGYISLTKNGNIKRNASLKYIKDRILQENNPTKKKFFFRKEKP